MIIHSLINCSMFSLALSCAAQTSKEPVMIGEGIISTPQDEFGGSLSPDGKTIYFDRSVPAHYLYTMWEAHLVGDKWQVPELLPMSGQYRDSDRKSTRL